ncbi:MAG TPA: type II toxin-antitoxin system VapC family toxin [Caulobacteraceae bacterium]|nr:type II toxin-antitoxin system VapC family toxin [Caulobacteraceae bacterium]
MSGGPEPSAVLLDTCALIWLAAGEPLRDGGEAAIVHAGLAGGVFVSPVSAWEIGMLSRPKTGRASVFLPDPATWFTRFMAGPSISPAAFTAEIAIAASWLPGSLHADPADRMLIATARHLAMPIVTRDSKILSYAAAGHVTAIAC